MFGRDPITPVASLLEPISRYWGDKGGHLQMDVLQRLYMLTAENLRKARESQQPKEEVKTTPTTMRDEAMELETSEILQVSGKYRPEKTGWCTRVLGVAMNNVWCSIKEGLENAAQSDVNFGGSDCIESIQDSSYWKSVKCVFYFQNQLYSVQCIRS